MSKKQPLKNAGKIIERFGGIRPMASKTDIPVTTVQGWKKRDVIPGTRRTQILDAASEHNIDISDLEQSSVSNENIDSSTKAVKAQKLKEQSQTNIKEKTPTKMIEEKKERISHSAVPIASSKNIDEALPKKNNNNTHEKIISEIETKNQRAIVTSAWITAALILLAMGVGFFLLLPYLKENQESIEAQTQQLVTLESEVEEVKTKSEKKFFGTSLPEGLQEKFDALQNQARNISITVDQLSEKAKEVSIEALGDNAQAIAERLAVLETKLEEMSGPDGTFAALIARIRDLEGSVSGQTQLRESANQLSSIVDNTNGNVRGDLANLQGEIEGALSDTLEGVSGNNLKAAAILIAFSQFRSSLEREAPFEEDLALLQNLIGDDDLVLQQNLSRLSQHADGGVLTAKGLSSELKKLTADVVVSYLMGEDVSIKEKAKARLGSIVQIEKDGEIISGTETQAKVFKAQEYLDKGKIEEGIVTLEGLKGPAAQTVSPLIDKAKATLLAEKVKVMLHENILSRTESDYMNGIDMGKIKQNLKNVTPFLGGRQIIKDEESGLSILPNKRSNGFKGFSGGQ